MRPAVDELIENICNECTVHIYALNRSSSGNINQRYPLRHASVEGNAKNALIELIKNFLISRRDIVNEIHSYFDYNIELSPCSEIEQDKIEGFEHILNQMSQYENLPRIISSDIKTVGYIIELTCNDKGYLFFQRIDSRQRLKKGKLNLLLNQGTFDRIIEPKNHLEFNSYFDFVYLGDFEKFLVFDRTNFEYVFNFKEFYSKKTLESIALMEEKEIKLSDDLKTIMMDKQHLKKKITKLYLGNRLREIKVEYLQENKDKYKEFNIELTIRDGKVHLVSEDDLIDFINVISENCVKEAASENKYIAKSKVKVNNE